MILFLNFTFISLMSFSANEDYLLKECNKGHGASCSYYASKLFNTNKELAAEYFKKACALGVQSSCVFDKKYKKPQEAVAKTITSEDKGGEQAQLESWASHKMAQIIASLDPTEAGVDSGGFSVDQCRMPLQEMVKLALGLSKSYSHTRRFGPSCDIDGTTHLSTERPFSVVAQVQKLGEVAKFECQVNLSYQKTSANEFRQNVKITQGIVYDAQNNPLAKYSITHFSDYAAQPNKLSAVEKGNQGRLVITEFRGQPVKFEKDFVLDHLIKRLVFNRSSGL